MADDFGFVASDNGVHTEEDPAAEFLAQQENEIAVIENDSAGFGFGALEDDDGPPLRVSRRPVCFSLIK